MGGASTLTALGRSARRRISADRQDARRLCLSANLNRATLAGNVVTASPIGDMPPVLLRAPTRRSSSRSKEFDADLAARRVLSRISKDGTRRRTRSCEPSCSRAPESLRASRAAPRATRSASDASSTSASRRQPLVVDTDAANLVTRARLAFGGVAATPSRARKTDDLLGRQGLERNHVCWGCHRTVRGVRADR